MTDIGTLSRYRPDPSRIGRTESWRRATASADITTESVVVTITGELDASNTTDFGHYIDHHSGVAPTLYVDLREVTFISTSGLAVLRRVQHLSAQRGSRWWLVPGPAVRKVLRICGAQDLPQRDMLAHEVVGALVTLA